MSEPKPTEHVIAHKMPSAGRVRVHGFRQRRYGEGSFRGLTDCGEETGWAGDKSWLWVEHRTLNPEKIVLCKRCWNLADPARERGDRP